MRRPLVAVAVAWTAFGLMLFMFAPGIRGALALEPAGEHQLKGLPGVREVFRLAR